MKQNIKLPNLQQKEPLVNELKQLVKNTEDIKALLLSLSHDTDNPIYKVIDKMAEQAEKQKRFLVKLVKSTLEKGTPIQSKADDTEQMAPVDKAHNQRQVSPIRHVKYEKPSSGLKSLDISDLQFQRLIEGQQSLIINQADILQETRQLIEKMGSVGATNFKQKLELTGILSGEEFASQLKKMQQMLQKNPEDTRPVQELVGSLFRQATNRAFEDYSGGMPEEDMKIKFAEEILSKYCKYILAIQSLKGYDVATIEKLQGLFEKLGSKTIEFLLFKYPQSRKKISDATLARHIKEVRRMTHPQYDMLRNGGIELKLTNLNQGLNKQLKTLINALIHETNDKFDFYKKYMIDIFAEEEKHDPSFSFLIGRKIKQTTSEYTEEQLNTPGFFIKNNEILRILIKWIEELISWFTDPKRTLDNQFGFKYQNHDEKLGVDGREDMWSRFQAKYGQLKQDFENAQLFIKRTLSSIVGISKNEIVRKYTTETVAYLSRNDILIPLICKYVSDTLQCYAVQLINACLKRTQEILQGYSDEHYEQAGYDLYSFTVNDLLRCKCTGKKEQVIRIYDKLRQKEEKGEIVVINVKNRLQGPTQDILITYKLKESFLLCEIQLALSSSNQEINDHFNHFLYEQHRSRHGIVCELAMLLNTLDPRRKYLMANKLSFLSQETAFSLQDNRIVCNTDPKLTLSNYKNDIPYMCSQCCRFIDAFRYYMGSMECKGCFKKLCPPCYLKILPTDTAVTLMLEPLPMLKGYFVPVSDPFVEYRSSKIEEFINKQLSVSKDSEEAKYLLMVVYKNNLYNWSLKIIKIYQEALEEEDDKEEGEGEISQKPAAKMQRHILESFTNKTINIDEFGSSMMLFMKPKNPVQKIKGDEIQKLEEQHKAKKYSQEPFQVMYELQDQYETDGSDVFCLMNDKTGQKMLIDYALSNDEIDEMMSEHKLRKLVDDENKNKNGRLVLNGLSLNFEILDEIKAPESITYLEIANCYEPVSSDEIEYSRLNKFKKLECLYISELEEYNVHQQYSFNDNLIELGLKSTRSTPEEPSGLTTFKNIPLQSTNLKMLYLSSNRIGEDLPKMNLPNLTCLELQQNEIKSISNLAESNLQSLDKLDLSDNKIGGQLPILQMRKLRVLVLKTNLITSINKLVDCELEGLKMIYLSDNKISGNVPDISKFKKLTQLDLQKNQLTGIHCVNSESLQTLNLSRNSIKGELPKLHMPSLIQLKINCNSIDSVESLRSSTLKDLQTLTIFDNPFKKFPSISFEELVQLDIEPEKMRFKVDPWKVNDNNDLDNISCDQCGNDILTFGCDFDLDSCEYICKDCLKKCDSKHKIIVVVMVRGSDLMRYS